MLFVCFFVRKLPHELEGGLEFKFHGFYIGA